MRTVTETGITRTGGFGGRRQAMSIDVASVEHIIGQLTGLYSDPEMAVVREYSTNAFDSHVEAGSRRPIEVTTPGPLSRNFVVKDFGVGMSEDDLFEIYALYGASTKRGTDEQVGMLGFGCKSALTYTDSFTLVTVKDGVRLTVYISINPDTGVGDIEVADKQYTDEPNGVEVRIAPKDFSSFDKKCQQFFRFWEPGTVLVNGHEPERVTGMPVGDDMLIVDGLDRDYVVMGNVAYPLDDHSDRISRNIGYAKRLVVWTPIGSVYPTPSRESLKMNATTKATLASISQRFRAGLQKSAAEQITAAPDHTAALRKYHEWKGIVSGKFDYRKQQIPDSFRFTEQVIKYTPYASRYATSRISTGSMVYSSEVIKDSFFVTDFTNQELSTHNRNKFREWMAQQGHAYRNVYFMQTRQGSPWLDGISSVAWHDVKVDRKKSTTYNPGSRSHYDVWNGSSLVKQDNITATEIVYFSPADDYNPKAVQQTFPNATVVQVAKNRWTKFERDYPGAKELTKAVADASKSMVDNLTKYDRMKLSASWEESYLNALKPEQIDDPDVADYVRGQREPFSVDGNAYKSYVALCREIGHQAPDFKKFDRPTKNYGLLSSLRHCKPADIYEYINAVYAARAARKE